MLSIAKVRGPLIMAIFPLQKYITQTKSVDEPVDNRIERIKKTFTYNQTEPIGKELRMLMIMSATAGIVGFLVGGTLHTRSTVQKFIDNNQATQFYSHYDAQRELHYSFSLQFIKGGFKLGWRTIIFTTIFGSIQLLLTTYYGEHSVWHYVAGGGIAGFLFKLSLGLRGSLVGLIVGSMVGGIGGYVNTILLKLTGLSIEDLQNMNQEWAILREERYRKVVQENLSEELKEGKLLYEKTKLLQEKLSYEEKVEK